MRDRRGGGVYVGGGGGLVALGARVATAHGSQQPRCVGVLARCTCFGDAVFRCGNSPTGCSQLSPRAWHFRRRSLVSPSPPSLPTLGFGLDKGDHVGVTPQPGQSRQPLQPDPELYPDVAAAGSLRAALAQCAAENNLDVGEVQSPSDGSSLIRAEITSRNSRLDRFSVDLGSAERVFLIAAWGQGVNLTNGATSDLAELAEAAAAWHSGITLAELQTAAPFLMVGPLALAHERGPEHAVAEKWRRYLTPDLYEDLEMFHAAYAEPRLRVLFPFTSHGVLVFSRCTGFPFSQDVSAIYPLGDHRYAVRHRAASHSRANSTTRPRKPRRWSSPTCRRPGGRQSRGPARPA